MHDLLMIVIIGLLLVTKLICRLVLNDNFERRRSYSKQEITVSSQVCVRKNSLYSSDTGVMMMVMMTLQNTVRKIVRLENK